MSCFYRTTSHKANTASLSFLGLFLMLTLWSCGDSAEQVRKTELPYQIDLVEAYKQNTEVPLSLFAKSIEYLPLESTDSALIGRFPHFYLFDDYLISIAFRQVFLFDRKTGNFIKEIQGYGNGPDEYRYTRPHLHADEKRGLVYVRDSRKVERGLNINGKTALRFNTPNDDRYYVTSYASLNNDLFIGFHPNPACDQNLKLVVFNKAGQVINTFSNHLECVNYDPGRISFNSSEGAFYHWNNQVGFKETYNDTLFMVSADTLSAKAVFNSGEFSLPYEEKKKLQIEDRAGYYSITSFDETDLHIFFQLLYKGNRHSGIYTKNTGKTQISRRGKSGIQGFTNDLDNFLPFNPVYATNQGELVGFIEAPDVIGWLDENPEKARALPPRLMELTNLREDDNPIVMVVKLKD